MLNSESTGEAFIMLYSEKEQTIVNIIEEDRSYVRPDNLASRIFCNACGNYYVEIKALAWRNSLVSMNYCDECDLVLVGNLPNEIDVDPTKQYIVWRFFGTVPNGIDDIYEKLTQHYEKELTLKNTWGDWEKKDDI